VSEVAALGIDRLRRWREHPIQMVREEFKAEPDVWQAEALEIFLKEPGRFDLVITDQIMPDLTGMDLVARMLGARKDLPIILFTGYSEMVSAEKAKSAGVKEFIMKPIVKKEIAETIRRVLDHGE